MNADASNIQDGGQTLLQSNQVVDLALKLEALMLNQLGQKHAGTPLTSQQQDALYVQAGNEVLQRIRDANCFVETVRAYTAMPP